MVIPEAFNEIASLFHQDTHKEYKTLESAAAASVSEMTREELQTAKSFLHELLSGKYNDEQLEAIWERTPGGSGGFGISRGRDGDAARFFEALHTAVLLRLSAKKPG